MGHRVCRRLIRCEAFKTACYRLGSDWSRFPMSVMSAPKLRFAHIHDSPHHLAALARSSSIREVVISVHDSVPANTLFESMLGLRVERLKIICVGVRCGCPFRDSKAFGPDVNALARCCSHLTSLEVSCSHFRPPDGQAIWRALPALSNLRELGFPSTVYSWNLCRKKLCSSFQRLTPFSWTEDLRPPLSPIGVPV